MVDTEQPGQSGQLTVRTDVVDGIVVVALAGEIDHQTAAPLREALDLPDGVAPHVVLDLRQVTFMDSSGINILLAVHQTLAQANGWLRLAGTTPSVQRVIQLVGIDGVIDCYPTVQQALDH
ncbi:stage II sporulation protein AA (anti-sigma F factor antagonist) [Streptomyces sp. 3213]|uniref:STAS domain-containing protein n=1 Tax=Streptomyces sp. 3213.3 TaxID=1855348 RepID=UPI0008992FD8|nr:STAS domain-containing protein [Streptomyces sp. 3213.3]SEC47617.1 stage II sporulation protein AA (anti-sigma F factor antagonist) [Streptomyces sp. 3213] [Streptomyces sp. 3213.3]